MPQVPGEAGEWTLGKKIDQATYVRSPRLHLRRAAPLRFPVPETNTRLLPFCTCATLCLKHCFPRRRLHPRVPVLLEAAMRS